jgi:hypothetical protein
MCQKNWRKRKIKIFYSDAKKARRIFKAKEDKKALTERR